MSIVKTIDVFCDGEGCVNWAENATRTNVHATLVRKRAREDGWIHRHGADLCPTCVANGTPPRGPTPHVNLDDLESVPISDIQYSDTFTIGTEP